MLTTWLGDGESEHTKLESLSYPRAPLDARAPHVDYSAPCSARADPRVQRSRGHRAGLFPIFAWE